MEPSVATPDLDVTPPAKGSLSAKRLQWLLPWRASLTTQVMWALVLGVACGALLPQGGLFIQPLSTVFLHMIKMLIAPLLFATLVVGIVGTGDHKSLGRMGARALIYFEVATTLALVIGLTVANVLRPGDGAPLGLANAGGAELTSILSNAQHQSSHGLMETLVAMVPTSVVDAMAKGDILQLVVFSVFFALALLAAGEKGKPVLHGLESLSEVMLKFVGYVMAFAPMGVFAAMAGTVAQHGVGVLLTYLKLVSSLYVALGLFVLIVLVGVCALIRVSFPRLVQAIKDPVLLAFSTASSEAALPKAMESLQRFGVPKHVVSFVLPTGYSFNLDGSTLYLSLAALFVAQAYHIELPLWSQITMLLTLMLTSKGVAAVPRASLVILTGTLAAFHLPVEGVALILGIDHVMDMGRTAVNLLGNCVASVVVARWEGVLDDTASGSNALAADDTNASPVFSMRHLPGLT